MTRGRWAAVLGLVACLLMLPLLAPGPVDGGPFAVTVTAATEPAAAGPAPDSGPAAAGDPCSCEKDPSLRQVLARPPRTAGAAGGHAPAAGAPGTVRDRAPVRAAGPARAPAAVATPPRAVELQAFRC
ncbi:hypothetical protein [Streptomyces sp. NPDC003456]|uniref:hypothetical protein n=1 Tax=Streptomyces sp. NPDC003456 TaxID=3364683 RepID=UPI0036783EE7